MISITVAKYIFEERVQKWKSSHIPPINPRLWTHQTLRASGNIAKGVDSELLPFWSIRDINKVREDDLVSGIESNYVTGNGICIHKQFHFIEEGVIGKHCH